VVAAGGGVVLLPPGQYNFGTTAVSFSIDASPIGITIYAYGANITYGGTGAAFTATMTGTGNENAVPTVAAFGLNFWLTGAATAGMCFNNCTMGRATDCSVIATGSVVDAYVFQNTLGSNSVPIWTEDFTMSSCYAGGSISNANIRFTQNGGTNSFARFTLNDFQTAGGQYVIDVQSGAVYDASVNNIRGNFAGQSYLRIRDVSGEANMQGSWVRGIHCENNGSASPYAFCMVDSVICDVPVLLDDGVYAKGQNWVSPYVLSNTGNAAPYTAVIPTAGQPLNVHCPIICDYPISSQGVQLTSGSLKQVLQRGTGSIASGTTTGSFTTTTAIWASATGCAGTLQVILSSNGGAGGSIASAQFAAEGTVVSAGASSIQSATRTGYYPLTITSVTVATTGLVTVVWTYASGGPATTYAWTVITETMVM